MRQLRAWRLRRFLTQRALAEKIGVPYQTVQRWESGEFFPRPAHLQRLCEGLDVTPDELLATDELEREPVRHRSRRTQSQSDYS